MDADIMEYKDDLFEKYHTTHIAHQKGEASLEEFKIRGAAFEKQFGILLSKDLSSIIIDLGCGNGSLVWWLQEMGYENIEGIDISAEQVEVANSLNLDNVTQADMRVFLRDKHDSYDVIFLRDVLEHFSKDEIMDILTLVHASLRKNGKIILQVPNAESPFFGRIRYGDFTHELAFTTRSLSQVFRMIGIEKVDFYPVRPLPGGAKRTLRSIVWRMVESIYRAFLIAEVGSGARIVTQNLIAVAVKAN